MRVLITGLTPTQCGRPGRFKWLVVPALFATALRRAGHTVEHRPTQPDEDLTPYDVILMGLVPPGSIAARHVYVAMDTIFRAKSAGAALLFYVDDWQFDKIMSGCRNKHKQPWGLYTTIKGRTFREWAETDEGRRRVGLSMEALATRPWPVTLSVAFPWGDHGKLDRLPAKETVYLDPSGMCWDTIEEMHLNIQTPPDDRAARWVLASLSNHQQWVASQNFGWPVELIGPKQTGADQTMREEEIVQLVRQSWGQLCPPYNHAGSGWWRPRYLYTASAGAVALPAAQDAAHLGDAYQVAASDIEQMSMGQLQELSSAQFSTLLLKTWTAQEFIDKIDKTLRDNLLGPVKEPKATPHARWVGLRIPSRHADDDNNESAPFRNPDLIKVAKEELIAEYPAEEEPEPQPVHREAVRREAREFDQTYMRLNKHGTRVHRDYGAHFFRWGWATRLIKHTDRVLDVGCGPDLSLPYVLSMGGRYVPERYVGVDLNKLSGGPGWAELHGEFNVIDRWSELLDPNQLGAQDNDGGPLLKFTKIVCFEVIEHMAKPDGLKLLSLMHELLEPDGTLLLSTPNFNGKAAVNHVHEWTIPELSEALLQAGFDVKERYGTFASYNDIKKVAAPDHLAVLNELRAFYSEEVTACFLAPLYPDQSRNNAWVCVPAHDGEGTEE